MSNIMDLKNSNNITGFDFGKMHEGIVVNNNSFETKGFVSVIVPELTIGLDDTRATSSTLALSLSGVMNDELKYKSDIIHSNYINCYPIVLNNFTIGHLKPRVGNRVMVFFINGDPKLPYFFNGHPLRIDEEIMKSTNEVVVEQDEYGYYRLIRRMAEPMTGPDVHRVGNKLKLLGYPIDMRDDGSYHYDDDMINAVTLFQRRMSITPDGEVGPITFSMLMRQKVKSRAEESIEPLENGSEG